MLSLVLFLISCGTQEQSFETTDVKSSVASSVVFQEPDKQEKFRSIEAQLYYTNSYNQIFAVYYTRYTNQNHKNGYVLIKQIWMKSKASTDFDEVYDMFYDAGKYISTIHVNFLGNNNGEHVYLQSDKKFRGIFRTVEAMILSAKIDVSCVGEEDVIAASKRMKNRKYGLKK